MNEIGDLERLRHISNCIIDLEDMLKGVDEDAFYRNTEKKYAVERVLEIIAESVTKMSDETLYATKNDVPWKEIKGFRIIVSHIYFRIDYTMVYRIATQEIVELKPVIEELIRKLETGNT